MLAPLKATLRHYLDRHGLGFGTFETPVPGLVIGHAGGSNMAGYQIYRPAIGLVVQGAKQVWLGEQVLDYREGEALLVTVSLLAKGVLTAATPEQPFLGLSLELDLASLRDVAALSDAPAAAPKGSGLTVHSLGLEALDCLTRIARLLMEPEAAPALYPALQRELCYWLLRGSTGDDLRAILTPDSRAARIDQALERMKRDVASPIRIDQLAELSGMSVTSFHRHFKAVTRSTPIQYLKQLRLVEARRLLDSGGGNVTEAAFAVGYESAAHFSRDYTRFYGVAPKRDTLRRRLGPPAKTQVRIKGPLWAKSGH